MMLFFELWTTQDSYDRDTLLEYAKKWQVCPFEMCLDLAVWVDAVICDYNYVFDPNVYLKKIFRGGYFRRIHFLIDEASQSGGQGKGNVQCSCGQSGCTGGEEAGRGLQQGLVRALEK